MHRLCNLKQTYTQNGGLRPFGVSFLFAGHDEHHHFQLYHSDPSGNYAGWKATCIGANSGAAQSLLKQEYQAGLSLWSPAPATAEPQEEAASNSDEKPEVVAVPTKEKAPAKKYGAIELALHVLTKTMDTKTLDHEKRPCASFSDVSPALIRRSSRS